MCVALGSLAAVGQGQDGLSLVNVMVGTAAEGQTFPATGVPFGMTQWTPQTRAGEVKCVSPYYAADRTIQGFRGSHFLSGSCTQDYGSFTVMPLADDSKLEANDRAAAFAHASERATPYRYGVELDTGIHAEMTGSLRAGMMEFRYGAKQKTGWITVENNLRLGTGTIQIDPVRQEITGVNPVYRIYAGSGKPTGFSGYVVVQFDRAFTVGGTWVGGQRTAGGLEQSATSGNGRTPGAYVKFALGKDRTVRGRIGTSFTSVDEARRNLAAEMPDWDFEAAVGRARAAWEAVMAKVQVGGSSPARRIFYTALYHANLVPRTYSDVSGTYPRFAGNGAIETAKGFTYYDDFSVWDTFRTLHPLMTILDPARDGEMVKSLILKGEQGGFLPIFPQWSSYTTEMTGDHVGAIVTDAYVKGVGGFDAEEAYRLMKKNATEEPASAAAYRDGQGRRSLESYLKYGYIPLEDRVLDAFHKDEQVSRTLDYAFDDFEVSTLARALGHDVDADYFAGRAQNYRNVIDQEGGFARGRHADGSWVTPFDPVKPVSYITESTPYVDTFFVPQDIPGLIELLGGRKAFAEKLDGVFSTGAYDHGNEPSHQIAYMYDFAGAPAKTQMHVHEIMTKLYRDEDGGLAGNDDAGQMSAWYCMSAMGFYQVTPGVARYSIGTPRFDEMTVKLGGGKSLHIRALGAEAGKFYVKAVRLNGVKLDRLWITHAEVVAGGDLEFEMTVVPQAEG